MPAITQISFSRTSEEDALIRQILDRAEERGLIRAKKDRMPSWMDLAATHANGCPLDFAKMLAFDDFNFAHDFTGIRNCLNRETGQLERCFVPRCALPEHVGA